MEPTRIQRINELARKKKSDGLSPEETEEHENLRKEYLAEYRTNMKKMLDSIVIQEKDGSRHPLKRKEPASSYKERHGKSTCQKNDDLV